MERKLQTEIPKLEFRWNRDALVVGGPVITTAIGVAGAHAQALVDAGQPVPDPIPCRFLVDTGAGGCVVKHEIADAAGLKLIATNVPLHGIGVDTSGRVYMGRVWFGVASKRVRGMVHQIFVETRISSGTLSASNTIDGVIGRDVLRYFEVIYNGVSGTMTLRYFRP